MADFFGVMHGQVWYPVNTPYLAVLADGGNNCYFRMPFVSDGAFVWFAPRFNADEVAGVFVDRLFLVRENPPAR